MKHKPPASVTGEIPPSLQTNYDHGLFCNFRPVHFQIEVGIKDVEYHPIHIRSEEKPMMRNFLAGISKPQAKLSFQKVPYHNSSRLIDELVTVIHPLIPLPTSSSLALLATSPVGIQAVGNGGDNFTIHYIKPPSLRSEATSTLVAKLHQKTHKCSPRQGLGFPKYIQCGLSVPSLFGLATLFFDSFPQWVAVCLARRKQFL